MTEEATRERVSMIVQIVSIIMLVIIVFIPAFYISAKENEEQPYVVRYGTVSWLNDEFNIFMDDWQTRYIIKEDPPEYPDGTEVRILFDSKGTKKTWDDKIIDITER